MSRYLACEAIGTLALVFLGTGAIVVDGASGGTNDHVGISLTFGLVVLALVYALGDVSGAHRNPAVSIAFAAAGRFRWRRVAGYVWAQIVGALAASAALRVLLPTPALLGAAILAGSAGQSFALEVLVTRFLMFAGPGRQSRLEGARRRRGYHPRSGGRARSSVRGPDQRRVHEPGAVDRSGARLVSGRVGDVWIYVAAPVIGALLAIPCSHLTLGADRGQPEKTPA